MVSVSESLLRDFTYSTKVVVVGFFYFIFLEGSHFKRVIIHYRCNMVSSLRTDFEYGNELLLTLFAKLGNSDGC